MRYGRVATMIVDLIDHMGSDLTVVNAARVSFNKESEWKHWPTDDNTNNTMDSIFTDYLEDKDEKLINYLARHNHWTPFGHCSAQFRITAPIFVARQLIKHQVGLVWNEVSRRYVSDSPEFWRASEWREVASDKKQGSSDQVIKENDTISYVYRETVRHCIDTYNLMLDKGVCPEQARAILPLSLLTEWYWSGTLAAFARVCKLRLSEDTQKETREVAELISNEMTKLFPVSWKVLSNGSV
jgi:thymidylate synthase (FAD)